MTGMYCGIEVLYYCIIVWEYGVLEYLYTKIVPFNVVKYRYE